MSTKNKILIFFVIALVLALVVIAGLKLRTVVAVNNMKETISAVADIGALKKENSDYTQSGMPSCIDACLYVSSKFYSDEDFESIIERINNDDYDFKKDEYLGGEEYYHTEKNIKVGLKQTADGEIVIGALHESFMGL